jgi:hypothetical protein
MDWSSIASGFVGPVNPNESRPVEGQKEEDDQQDTELARLRGMAMVNEEVDKLLGWTFRKDYPTLIGIALPIKDWAGEEFHEIQFWEETSEPFQVLQNPAAEVYDWLVERMREHSQTDGGRLPQGIPPNLEYLSVNVFRTGKAGHILFEPLDSWARNLSDQPVQVQIEYRYGYTRLGMGGQYAIRMLASEFWALTHNDWRMYPKMPHARLTDGTIRHETTDDAASLQVALAVDLISEPPVRIQEDAGRGTHINCEQDRARLLQYWAWARQNISVGVAVSVDNTATEYWFNLVLDPLPDDDDGRMYAEVLRQMWLEKLGELSPRIAQKCANLGINFSHKIRAAPTR